MSEIILLSINPNLFICSIGASTIGGGIYGAYQAISGTAQTAGVNGKRLAALVGFAIGAAEGIGFGIFGIVVGVSMHFGAQYMVEMGMISQALTVAGLSSAITITVPTLGTYLIEKLTPFTRIGRMLGGGDDEMQEDQMVTSPVAAIKPKEQKIKKKKTRTINQAIAAKQVMSIREQRLQNKKNRESNIEPANQPAVDSNDIDDIFATE